MQNFNTFCIVCAVVSKPPLTASHSRQFLREHPHVPTPPTSRQLGGEGAPSVAVEHAAQGATTAAVDKQLADSFLHDVSRRAQFVEKSRAQFVEKSRAGQSPRRLQAGAAGRPGAKQASVRGGAHGRVTQDRAANVQAAQKRDRARSEHNAKLKEHNMMLRKQFSEQWKQAQRMAITNEPGKAILDMDSMAC